MTFLTVINGQINEQKSKNQIETSEKRPYKMKKRKSNREKLKSPITVFLKLKYENNSQKVETALKEIKRIFVNNLYLHEIR